MEHTNSCALRSRQFDQPTSGPTPARCNASFLDVSQHLTETETPPETPTRSDSVTSTHIKRTTNRLPASEQRQKESNAATEGILHFSARSGDYEVLKGSKLGSGRFSSVYLARIIPPTTQDQVQGPLTPPATPTGPQSRGVWSGPQPSVYAIKVAVDKSTAKTLRGEARILSLLSQSPKSSQNIVCFHGFDPRCNSLVLAAMPGSLEDLVNGQLQFLDLATRTAKLGAIFLHIARSLTSGLAWMHSLGVVHADIKPPNMLLRPDMPVQIPLSGGQQLLDLSFTPVFADFTSSFTTTDDSKTISSVGGGTYDYMAPEQLAPPFPVPNFKMDVYALAVSLLQVTTGFSPFREAGSNRHMKMAMIKEGKALSWAMRDAISAARLKGVADVMLARHAIDLRALLELGLRKNPNERLDAASWNRLW
ncbi:uncharacterized protein PV09_06144 [Verruconis gallopava]|uniref:Protein kinase domain-containing protein n=1 Tax=Verruconis gallopava TaxID=253628 RepID=A0A0D1XK44_9PEZI|nr:uncharacterized protein PV09_06144 [Verruconis gallopava]KIW02706.1 hypothetical protein PV09_06144 [Verruconis gallopava]